MQEEFDHGDAVLGEQGLERVDLCVPGRPHLPGHELAHPGGEHVFVVGPVEDRDVPLGGDRSMDPPQEVVIRFFGRRALERRHATPLRVEPGNHVAELAGIALCQINCIADDRAGGQKENNRRPRISRNSIGKRPFP